MNQASQTHEAAIELHHVTKTYRQWQRTSRPRDILKNLFAPQARDIAALLEVSLRVNKGEFVAYAGPNGAGKSTTMKLLCGMLAPTSGKVRTLGLHPQKQRIPLMQRTGVLFGQRTELWQDHPLQMSFEWKRAVWDIPPAQYQRMADLVVDLLDLGPLMKTYVRELSLGQRLRGDLGLTLLHQPQLLLLDEPTLGLDVLGKRQLIAFLKHLHKEEGTTIVVTSHDMDDLEQMAQRLVLIAHGKIAFDGSFEALRRQAPQPLRVQVVEERGAPIEEVIAGLYEQWAKVPLEG